MNVWTQCLIICSILRYTACGFFYHVPDPQGLLGGDINLRGRTVKDVVRDYKMPKQTKGLYLAAVKDLRMKWPNGVVYYVVGDVGSRRYKFVKRAMRIISRLTCIKFEPRTTQPDYIYVFFGEGCWSDLGRIGGIQGLSLGLHCDKVGLIIHELLHTLGFDHEHTRSDRDDFIDVFYANVEDEQIENFYKYALDAIELLDIEYDYRSILHYSMYEFSKNGAPTIVPKVKRDSQGRLKRFRTGYNKLSKLDRKRVNKFYGCMNHIS